MAASVACLPAPPPSAVLRLRTRARRTPLNRAPPAPRRRTAVVRMASSDVFALDFDGIICDSCGESSLSAWKAAEIQWPDLFGESTAAYKEKCMEQMRAVRPVVEVGYENVLLVRMLLEAEMSGDEPDIVNKILQGWTSMAEGLYGAYGVSKDEMLKLFGDTRDEWIADDFEGWMEPNRFYDGVGDALRACPSEFYIVTTKQGRFASALLDKMGGVQIPEDSQRMYALGSGPKKQTLKKLQEKHEGSSLIFVEDRLATLETVIKEQGLEGWKLYLGDWGYNTPEERERAAGNPRIEVIDLATFSGLLRGGSD